MIKINELLAFPGSVCRPGTKLRGFRGVTIHDTGNNSATANAKAHADLLRSGWRDKDVSWHYSVDDHSIYRSIPEDEVAWHAGDGSQGTGNNETVAIETCVNDGNNYDLTLAHTADLAADILFRHGAKSVEDHLFQHNYWTGKDCPHVIRKNNLWKPFCDAVQQRLTALWAPPEPVPEPDGTYTIQPGDTFWGIARKLNIPLKDILDANAGVDPYNLHVGQVILLPGADVYVVHTIKAGDTFWGLSRHYGRPVAEIMMTNPGVDPYQLQIGQKIRIPQ
jgi:LysM repeat protein